MNQYLIYEYYNVCEHYSVKIYLKKYFFSGPLKISFSKELLHRNFGVAFDTFYFFQVCSRY